jgi:hypothetical protein
MHEWIQRRHQHLIYCRRRDYSCSRRRYHCCPKRCLHHRDKSMNGFLNQSRAQKRGQRGKDAKFTWPSIPSPQSVFATDNPAVSCGISTDPESSDRYYLEYVRHTLLNRGSFTVTMKERLYRFEGSVPWRSKLPLHCFGEIFVQP